MANDSRLSQIESRMKEKPEDGLGAQDAGKINKRSRRSFLLSEGNSVACFDSNYNMFYKLCDVKNRTCCWFCCTIEDSLLAPSAGVLLTGFFLVPLQWVVLVKLVRLGHIFSILVTDPQSNPNATATRSYSTVYPEREDACSF